MVKEKTNVALEEAMEQELLLVQGFFVEIHERITLSFYV
jgi:hypothetical protein